MPDVRLISHKVKKIPSTNVDPNRYSFLNLQNAEPDFGVPAYDNGIAGSGTDGVRKWLYIANSNVDINNVLTINTNLDVVTGQGNITTNGITIGNLSISDIFINNNTISTVANNSNLTLDPDGSGAIIFQSAVIQNAVSAPDAPAPDAMAIYVTASGDSPTREVAWKMKNENGDEIIISSLLV